MNNYYLKVYEMHILRFNAEINMQHFDYYVHKYIYFSIKELHNI